ncbi:MAG: phosphate transport system regulatory protein PhoU, partial [Acetobacteraceae bacterium]|nr:phosphate transport system regulatory protein PhoU [Acetobacteraceae bacterium]
MQEGLKTVLDAIAERDTAKAIDVCRSDQIVDDLYTCI